jgi:hypothetical protein
MAAVDVLDLSAGLDVTVNGRLNSIVLRVDNALVYKVLF